jgi:hypothetical protein
VLRQRETHQAINIRASAAAAATDRSQDVALPFGDDGDLAPDADRLTGEARIVRGATDPPCSLTRLSPLVRALEISWRIVP